MSVTAIRIEIVRLITHLLSLLLRQCPIDTKLSSTRGCSITSHSPSCREEKFSETGLPVYGILGNSLEKSQCHAHLEGIDVCFELHCFAFSDRPHVHGRHFELPSGSTHTAPHVPDDDHVTLLVIDELVGHNHRLDGLG